MPIFRILIHRMDGRLLKLCLAEIEWPQVGMICFRSAAFFILFRNIAMEGESDHDPFENGIRYAVATSSGQENMIGNLAGSKHHVKTEMITGLTTFITMRYIIFIHHSILSDAESQKKAAWAATIFSSVIGTHGLVGQFPVTVAREWD